MDEDLVKLTAKVEDVERRITKLEKLLKTNTTEVTNAPTVQKKFSLREFLISKNPSDDVKKTLAVGYYLEKNEGCRSFNISDLEGAIERAKEKQPSNMNDKVNMNIKNGHMEEASEKKGNRKAWYLTNSGELFVENGFKTQK